MDNNPLKNLFAIPDLRNRVLFTLALLALTGTAQAQSPPNPYRLVEGWAKLSGVRQIGAVGDVDIDPDGKHVWAILRCASRAP